MLRKSILVCIVTSFCLVTSCAKKLEEKIVHGYSNVRFSSLKKYADEGFLITPSETYGANYNSIGFISIETMLDAAALIVEVEVPSYDKHRHTTKKVIQWNAPMVPQEGIEAMIDELYQVALSQGADAIINVKIEIFHRTLKNPTGTQLGSRIKGFAIDRLD